MAELTKHIVTGYTKTVQKQIQSSFDLFSIIPLSVINVICLYINNIFSNRGVYTWKIDDIVKVKQILNAKNGDKFESNTFMISRLKCKLVIYPNGDTEELKGWFVIHLVLLSLPSYIKHINCLRIFRVLENKASDSYLPDISPTMHDYWSTKCPLQELIDLDVNTITVQVELKMNQIWVLKYLNFLQSL